MMQTRRRGALLVFSEVGRQSGGLRTENTRCRRRLLRVSCMRDRHAHKSASLLSVETRRGTVAERGA